MHPLSGFGTALKGDTLFGHFCWQVAYQPSLVKDGLEHALSVYEDSPFAIFSSVFPKLEKTATNYVLKRPDIPLSWMFPFDRNNREINYKSIKDFKKKKWMVLTDELEIDLKNIRFIDERQLFKEILYITTPETRMMLEKIEDSDFISYVQQPHNTINRLMQTTGTGIFAPYVKENIFYCPEMELVLFVLIDENMTHIDRIIEGLENIGRFGFGRDASIGMGRFEICEWDEIKMPSPENANACYVLAPCVPEKNIFEESYFSPFIRFGKHGDRLAGSRNPFKNPIIMADEGSVFIPKGKNVFKKPYIGRAVKGVSKVQHQAVVQGYAPYLPMKLEY